MFFEKRVYQGSSGKVYPLPFTDHIAEKPVDRAWKAVWLENEFLRVLVLPEIGGRIHAIQDKTNGYDLIYNQHVIKPALVGLAGPWVSGGIEFNWPQHHRPATFLPVDYEIEENPDGSKTVWCSDHDPMARMKGMHGVCLRPGRAIVELKVRAYNRTPFVQTFLWWANVATRVHEAYQSFFPPDVYCVADHARRSMSEYPLAQGFYYGVNYGERGRNGVPPGERPSQFIPAHCLDEPRLGAPASLPASPEGHPSASKNADAPRTEDVTQTRRSCASSPPSYAPNDLSFYANIPTPCSYMCLGSAEGFSGGYDYFAQAGLVHVANPHISPGKKQWTWGNHEFGYAWDRNLTAKDANGQYPPYIEIMAGVYSDNQPDFSFLQPGETKTWSQFWYSIRKIGPVQHANLDAAVSLKTENGALRAGVSVTRPFNRARITISANGLRPLLARNCRLAPDQPFLSQIKLPPGLGEPSLMLRVTDAGGREIISYQPKPRPQGLLPAPAAEPLAPCDVPSADELYHIGLHLDQYRHATRCPTLYWREALRRDALDARCNNALGLWHMRRGEFTIAEAHFRKAIERITSRNSNPYDGEPYYNLGLCLRYQLDTLPPNSVSLRPSSPSSPARQSSVINRQSYAAFYKATWNQAWQPAAFHALAELDCRRTDWETALDHLDRSLRLNTDNTRARNLKAVVLRKLNRASEAQALLQSTLSLDPLDWWARHLAGQPLTCDTQIRLDLAHDYSRAGLYREAIALIENTPGAPSQPARVPFLDLDPCSCSAVYLRTLPSNDLPNQNLGSLPLLYYTLAWLYERAGDPTTAQLARRRAALASPDYCFPARLEEIAVLESAIRANPQDARAPYYLGNLLYDRRRHLEAIGLWKRSASLAPDFPIVWRNLGIGYFNNLKAPAKARLAYDKAFRAAPNSARVLFERDQLWKRLGEKPERRLRELERRLDLVRLRDDLSVELCALYNQTGRPAKALDWLASRRFQPWEGGEGGPLGQHTRAHMALGRRALDAGKALQACKHFEAALSAPPNLGEARHLLANYSDVHYWLGQALAALGQTAEAREHWHAAATFKGDFQEMKVCAFSEMTYYSAMSWERLGQKTKAKRLLRDLLAYAQKLQKTPAKIDFFATSLPAMLLFDDDLQSRQETTALFLQAQAHLGLGHTAKAKRLFALVTKRDPNHTFY